MIALVLFATSFFSFAVAYPVDDEAKAAFAADPAAADLKDKYPSVEVLTDARFESIVFPTSTPPHEQRPFLVMFFAPWCQHCRSILPSFNNASAILFQHDAYRHNSARLAIVDATANKRLARKFHVSTYPTFFYTLNGRAHEYNAAASANDFLQVAAYLFAGKKFTTFADDFSNVQVLDQVLGMENPIRPLLVNCVRTSSQSGASIPPLSPRSAFDMVADSTVTYGKVRYGRIVDDDATARYWNQSILAEGNEAGVLASASSPWSAGKSYLAREIEEEVSAKVQRGVDIGTLPLKQRVSVMHWRMKSACWEGWRLVDAKARRRAAFNATLLAAIRNAKGVPSVYERLLSVLQNSSNSIGIVVDDNGTTAVPQTSSMTSCSTDCFSTPRDWEIDMEAATPSVSPDGTFMFMMHDSTERPIYFKGHWGREIAAARSSAPESVSQEASEELSVDIDELEGDVKADATEPIVKTPTTTATLPLENADVIRVQGASGFQVHPQVYHFFLQYGILAVDLLSPERLSHLSKNGKMAIVALDRPLPNFDEDREYVPTLRHIMRERYASLVFEREHAARIELVQKEYAELAKKANRVVKRVFKRRNGAAGTTKPILPEDEILANAVNSGSAATAEIIAQRLLAKTSTGRDINSLVTYIREDRVQSNEKRDSSSIFAELEAKAYGESVLYPSQPVSRFVSRQRSMRKEVIASSQHLTLQTASVLFGHPTANNAHILHVFVGDFETYKDWIQTYGYTGDSAPVFFVTDMQREIGWRVEDWLPPGRSVVFSKGNANGIDADATKQHHQRVAFTLNSFMAGVESGEVKGVSTSYIGMIALILLEYVPFMTELHALTGGENTMFVLVVGCIMMFIFVIVLSITRGAAPDEVEPPIAAVGGGGGKPRARLQPRPQHQVAPASVAQTPDAKPAE